MCIFRAGRFSGLFFVRQIHIKSEFLCGLCEEEQEEVDNVAAADDDDDVYIGILAGVLC